MPETQITVTIENLAPEGGTFLTPFWVGFHNGDFDSYDRGSAISPGLERLVEDGDTAPFSEEFLASGYGVIDGTILGTEGIEGPIDPGETTSLTFTLDSEADTSQFFSYASMVIPSNDAFIANGNPEAHRLFDDEGNFIGDDLEILVAGNQVLDGGTEVNDELPENTAFFGQAAPDTGEVENGVVTVHPGFIEGGRILSEDGTTEGAPAAFNNADFTAEGYEVARITFSEVELEPEPELIDVTVTIENLAPEAGTFLTPFWVGFHDGDFDVYDRGLPISPGLERLVEDGDTAPFSAEFLASGDGIVDGTIAGTEGVGGPIDPGEITSLTFTIDANADTSQFFSYASMVIPSNDAFIANGNERAFQLFDDEGNFVGADFTVLGSQVLDGGTEVNDELAETTAFFSQSVPDTGEVENGVVTVHPGFIEGGRILSEDGTTEGAPAAFNNADFTADGYEVARITVALADDTPEVTDPVNIVSTLDAAQELAGGDEDASGTSILTLNDTGDTLEFSLTVSGLDFGANGLIEGGATTEDTSDDVTRIHIHNAARGENGPVAFSIFDTVAPELGNVLEIQGNQDEDLIVTANDDGSVTLTGAWEESDPAAIALSEFVDEIRETGSGDDIDLYWNIHTEEFPGGAIRGQLEVAEENSTDTIDLFRFRNTSFDTGAYVFVGEAERDAILANPDFNQTFALDGVQEDGSITPAFTASNTEGEDLIPFFRLESLAQDTLGTFLFVSTEELNAIFAEGSDQADQWARQGFDENGVDIPEFYLFDGVADRGEEFNRFQNNENGTFLFAGPEESTAIANDSALAGLFTNQGVAFESV